MLEYNGPKILSDAEMYEVNFWRELEELDYLKTKINEDKFGLLENL